MDVDAEPHDNRAERDDPHRGGGDVLGLACQRVEFGRHEVDDGLDGGVHELGTGHHAAAHDHDGPFDQVEPDDEPRDDGERADGEDKVIYKTTLDKVGRAETLIHLIENEYKDIDYFSENEYDFKKVKGIIARFTYPGEEGMKTFYIAKILPASSALKGSTSWEINGESFEPFSAEVAIKMPDDNQVAIVEQNIIVFNQAKFENLFQYDYKSQVLAEAKAKELTEKYKLSFSEGLTLDSLLADKKPLLKKVQAMDIAAEMPQDKLIDYADEMQLELMTDDDGSIIIMDDKDLTMFVNLLNEDYYVSPVNGRRYEIKSKKLLGEPDGEPPRG